MPDPTPELPQTGGSWVRDPVTGALTPETTAPPAEPATPPAAPEAAPKKGRQS